MRIGRIVVGSVAVATIAAAIFHFAHDRVAPDTGSESWLSVPDMDANDVGIRALLLRNAEADPEAGAATSPLRSLAGRCGYDDGPAEQYSLTIGDHWFVENRKAWHVTVSMYGDSADVVIRDAAAIEMPPPPDSPYGRAMAPAVRHVVARSRLEGIRNAWSDPELWLLPQSPNGCFDGHLLVMEACVHGRYGSRSRPCGGTGREAGRLLWQRLRETFPDPPSARWK